MTLGLARSYHALDNLRERLAARWRPEEALAPAAKLVVLESLRALLLGSQIILAPVCASGGGLEEAIGPGTR